MINFPNRLLATDRSWPTVRVDIGEPQAVRSGPGGVRTTKRFAFEWVLVIHIATVAKAASQGFCVKLIVHWLRFRNHIVSTGCSFEYYFQLSFANESNQQS